MAPVTRITCRATRLTRPPSIVDFNAPVTRITCRAAGLTWPPSIVASNTPVTSITCRATVLARPPSIVDVLRLSLVLHVELLGKPVHHLLSLYGACHSYYM